MCSGCGQALRVPKRGRPPTRCPSCRRVADRAARRRWYHERGGAAKVAAYHRERFGYRPKRSITCGQCGAVEVRYASPNLCRRCERRLNDRFRRGQELGRTLPCMSCGAAVVVSHHQFGTGGGVSQVMCEDCRSRAAKNVNRRKNLKRKGVTPARYRLDEIAERDDWHCHICSLLVNPRHRYPHPRSPTIDHLIPIADGGTDDPVNVALAHAECNRKRGTGGTVQLRALA